MDIEGFVRARIDDYTYDDLADILAVRIREYKKISEENSIEMAKAVIDEVSTTLKLQESDDEFLKEIANVNKADVLMGEMGVGSRGAGERFFTGSGGPEPRGFDGGRYRGRHERVPVRFGFAGGHG